MKYFVKSALLISGILLLLLLWKVPSSYAQNIAPLLPSPVAKEEKPIDEVVVIFNQKPNTKILLNLAKQNLNIKPEHGIASSNAMVYSVKDGNLDETVSQLSQNQNVKTVFPNHRLNPLKVTNDPGLNLQWSFTNLKLSGTGNSAWDATSGSQNVTVGVIDTGVESSHPDLVGKIASLVDCSGANCTEVSSMSDPDEGGHGTHVSGLVAAATDNGKGVAGSGFNTKITVLKIMDAAGTIGVDNLFNALTWAADHGIKVVNMSVGQVEENLDTASIDEMKQKIDYAWSKGVLMVAAAGNCGSNEEVSDCAILDGQGNISGYAHNSKVYPAALSNVLSVTSLTYNNTIASYSEHNDGSNTKIGNWVSVAAPGGECDPNNDIEKCIISTIPQNLLPTPPPPTPAYEPYFYNMGTSMASPQVAGVAALVLAINPNLANEQVKTIIETTANKSIAGEATNFGAVDALAAVTAASSGGGGISVTPGGPTLTGAPPPKPPTATPYPTVPPFMRNQEPSPFPTGPYCPQSFLPGGNCTLESKNQGDANCDGAVNALDFSLWLNQLDKMVAPQPVNQNANFSCVEGNKSTYFIDMVDFEIWRRFTTEGLVTPGPANVANPTAGATPGGGEPAPTTGEAQPSATPATANLASCTNPAGSCITACIRVNNGRDGGMTEFTSSDVTIKPGDFVEFRPEPVSGNSADFNTPAYSPAQQCSALLGGSGCPAHFPISAGHGFGQGSVVAYRPLGGQWWQQDPTCRDSLNITIAQ